MADRIQIIDARGGRRTADVTGANWLLGSGEGVDLRLQADGVDPQHLRFVRTDVGYRVEAARPGKTVEVNGEELFCKDLKDGDEIALGGLTVLWVGDERPPAEPARPAASARETRPPKAQAPQRPQTAPQPQAAAPSPPLSSTRVAPRSPAARERDREPRTSRRTPRPRGVPTAALVSGLVGLLVLGGVLAFRALAGSTWPQTPQHYVDLARAQLGNNDPQRALDTLAFALRDATGDTRTEALQLEADIKRALVEGAELHKVVAARGEHDLLLGFVGRYLRDAAPRPAAREFVRQCDDWLQRNGDLCRRHPDGKPLVKAIEDHRSRYVAIAALGEPDTAADVLFAAQARLRFQWRDYKGALRALEAFLLANPADDAVQKARAQMLAEGEEWLRGKLTMVDAMLARGDDRAATDLAQIERWSMLPQWEPMVQERKQRLPGGR